MSITEEKKPEFDFSDEETVKEKNPQLETSSTNKTNAKTKPNVKENAVNNVQDNAEKDAKNDDIQTILSKEISKTNKQKQELTSEPALQQDSSKDSDQPVEDNASFEDEPTTTFAKAKITDEAGETTSHFDIYFNKFLAWIAAVLKKIKTLKKDNN